MSRRSSGTDSGTDNCRDDAQDTATDKKPEADKRRQTKGIADEETEMPEKYGSVPSAKILDNTVSHSHMPAMEAKGKSTCGMLHIWKSIKKGFRQ